MRSLEIKLREGMDKNQVGIPAQEEIIQSISSFALYGFPESHGASFALIAYASAWLKFHYLGAFTAAILNNQPMGFYSAAVLVKDAQRHGLRVRPIDVMRSSWPCTLEHEEGGSLLWNLRPQENNEPSLPSKNSRAGCRRSLAQTSLRLQRLVRST
jgi:error-prone DNA polymerase